MFERLVIAIITLLIGVAAGAYIQQGRVTEAKAELTLCNNHFVSETERITIERNAHERELQTKYDAAIAKSNLRVETLDRELTDLRKLRGGVRQQLATTAQRIPDASSAALTGYTITLGELFNECTERYSELAGQAQKHVESIMKFQEAWPHNVERK